MSRQMTEDQIYEQAKKRVEARRSFFVHLTVYIVVNIMLVMIWAFASGGGHPWFIYPLGGWGMQCVKLRIRVRAQNFNPDHFTVCCRCRTRWSPEGVTA